MTLCFNDASDVFIEGTCISLLRFLALKYVLTAVVFIHVIFCSMFASVMILWCICIQFVYFVQGLYVLWESGVGGWYFCLICYVWSFNCMCSDSLFVSSCKCWMSSVFSKLQCIVLFCIVFSGVMFLVEACCNGIVYVMRC